MELNVEALKGNLTAKTSSGNIKITLPEGSAFTYRGSSSSGNIRTSFDDKLNYNQKGNQAEGTWRTGAVLRIGTKASNGNTSVKFS